MTIHFTATCKQCGGPVIVDDALARLDPVTGVWSVDWCSSFNDWLEDNDGYCERCNETDPIFTELP